MRKPLSFGCVLSGSGALKLWPLLFGGFCTDVVKDIKDMSADLYMAFSNKTPDMIVEKCKKALFEIRKDGTYNKINRI